MNKKLIELLKKMGWSDEMITLYSETDETKIEAIDVNESYGTIITGIKKSLENDSDFIDPIHKKIKGELYDTTERTVRKEFDISSEEYNALPEKDRFKSLLGLVKTKTAAPGDDGDKDKEILKLRKNLKEKDDAIKEYEEIKLPEAKNLGVQREKQINKEYGIKNLIGKHDIVVSGDFAFKGVMTELETKYDVRITDDKKIELYQKGKDLKAFKDNVEVTAESEIKNILETEKLLKKSQGNPKPGDPPRREQREDSNKFPGLKKAQEHVEELKKKD